MASALDILSLAALGGGGGDDDDGQHEDRGQQENHEGPGPSEVLEGPKMEEVSLKETVLEHAQKIPTDPAATPTPNPKVSGVKRKASISSAIELPVSIMPIIEAPLFHTPESGPTHRGLPPSLANILSSGGPPSHHAHLHHHHHQQQQQQQQQHSIFNQSLPQHHPTHKSQQPHHRQQRHAQPKSPTSHGHPRQQQAGPYEHQQPFGATPSQRTSPVRPSAALPVPSPTLPPVVEQYSPPTPLPEDSGIIRCICPYDDDDGFTIQCERCFAWQHGLCVTIGPDSVPDKYLCPLCSYDPEDATGSKKGVTKEDVERATELQKLRKEAENRLRQQREALGLADPSSSALESEQDEESELLAKARGLAQQQKNLAAITASSSSKSHLSPAAEVATPQPSAQSRKASGHADKGNSGTRRSKSNSPAGLQNAAAIADGKSQATPAGASDAPSSGVTSTPSAPPKQRRRNQHSSNLSGPPIQDLDHAMATPKVSANAGTSSKESPSAPATVTAKRRRSGGNALTQAAAALSTAAQAFKDKASETTNNDASVPIAATQSTIASTAQTDKASASASAPATTHTATGTQAITPTTSGPTRPNRSRNNTAAQIAVANAVNESQNASLNRDPAAAAASGTSNAPASTANGPNATVMSENDDDAYLDDKYEPWQFEYTPINRLRYSDKELEKQVQDMVDNCIREELENVVPNSESMQLQPSATATATDEQSNGTQTPNSVTSSSLLPRIISNITTNRPILLHTASFLSQQQRTGSPALSSGSSTPAYSSSGVASALSSPMPPIILSSNSSPTAQTDFPKLSVKPLAHSSLSLAPPACLPFGTPTCVPSLTNPYPRPTVHGVFSNFAYSSGSLLTFVHGEVLRGKDYRDNHINQWAEMGVLKNHVRGISQPWDLVLDQRKWSDESRFIRMGCHPNVYIRPVIVRKPKEGEQPTGPNTFNGQIHPLKRTKTTRKKYLTLSRQSSQPPTAGEDYELVFGLYALQDITKREELVLPFDWADDHVVHSLHTLLFNPSLIFPSIPANVRYRDSDTEDDDVPSTSSYQTLTPLQKSQISQASRHLYRLSRLASRTCLTLLGNVVCACEKRRDCAIHWLWRLASFSESTGTLKTNLNNKGNFGRIRLEDFDLEAVRTACLTAMASEDKELGNGTNGVSGAGANSRSASKKTNRKRRADIGALVGLVRGWEIPEEEEMDEDEGADAITMGFGGTEPLLQSPEPDVATKQGEVTTDAAEEGSTVQDEAKQDDAMQVDEAEAPASTVPLPVETDVQMEESVQYGNGTKVDIAEVREAPKEEFDFSSNLPPILRSFNTASSAGGSIIKPTIQGDANVESPKDASKTQNPPQINDPDDSGSESDLTEPLPSGGEEEQPVKPARTPKASKAEEDTMDADDDAKPVTPVRRKKSAKAGTSESAAAAKKTARSAQAESTAREKLKLKTKMRVKDRETLKAGKEDEAANKPASPDDVVKEKEKATNDEGVKKKKKLLRKSLTGSGERVPKLTDKAMQEEKKKRDALPSFRTSAAAKARDDAARATAVEPTPQPSASTALQLETSKVEVSTSVPANPPAPPTAEGPSLDSLFDAVLPPTAFEAPAPQMQEPSEEKPVPVAAVDAMDIDVQPSVTTDSIATADEADPKAKAELPVEAEQPAPPALQVRRVSLKAYKQRSTSYREAPLSSDQTNKSLGNVDENSGAPATIAHHTATEQKEENAAAAVQQSIRSKENTSDVTPNQTPAAETPTNADQPRAAVSTAPSTQGLPDARQEATAPTVVATSIPKSIPPPPPKARLSFAAYRQRTTNPSPSSVDANSATSPVKSETSDLATPKTGIIDLPTQMRESSASASPVIQSPAAVEKALPNTDPPSAATSQASPVVSVHPRELKDEVKPDSPQPNSPHGQASVSGVIKPTAADAQKDDGSKMQEEVMAGTDTGDVSMASAPSAPEIESEEEGEVTADPDLEPGEVVSEDDGAKDADASSRSLAPPVTDKDTVDQKSQRLSPSPNTYAQGSEDPRRRSPPLSTSGEGSRRESFDSARRYDSPSYTNPPLAKRISSPPPPSYALSSADMASHNNASSAQQSPPLGRGGRPLSPPPASSSNRGPPPTGPRAPPGSASASWPAPRGGRGGYNNGPPPSGRGKDPGYPANSGGFGSSSTGGSSYRPGSASGPAPSVSPVSNTAPLPPSGPRSNRDPPSGPRALSGGGRGEGPPPYRGSYKGPPRSYSERSRYDGVPSGPASMGPRDRGWGNRGRGASRGRGYHRD